MNDLFITLEELLRLQEELPPAESGPHCVKVPILRAATMFYKERAEVETDRAYPCISFYRNVTPEGWVWESDIALRIRLPSK